MTPEYLEELRVQYVGYSGRNVRDLIAHVDDLTRQLDDARRMVIDSRYFQNTQNEWYEPAYPTDELPAVGPVAWDKQEQHP